MKRIGLMWICLLALSSLLVGCGQSAQGKAPEITNNPTKQTAFLMGTIVTVKVYDEGKEAVLEPVFERIESLANDITQEDEAGSEIVNVNRNAGINPVKVSEDIYKLIDAGKNHSKQAEGSFDISVGPLTSLWHIGFPDARVPEQSELDEVLPLIDYEKIELNQEEQTVFLTEKGMKLDLGAIAKGYITDEVKEVLEEHQVQSAIIDLGGNIYVLGKNAAGKAWTVGIQDPFSARGETVGKIPESNKSIVTSGVYERYLEAEGTKYHHLLNPKDGYPFTNDIAGVSIISDKSIDGDALSTAVFSKGIREGRRFIEDIEGAEAIFVSHDKRVYTTSGLKKEFVLTNDEFEMEQ